MKIKTLLKKWWFWVIVVVVVIVGVVLLLPEGPSVEYVTESARVEDLSQTVDASGEVVSIDEVELSFDLSGELAQVLVDVGELVEADTLLASLDTTELLADVQTAFKAMGVAQATLEQQQAGSAEETILVSQLGVEVAQVTAEAAAIDLASAVANAPLIEARYSADVVSAQDNLSQTQVDNAESISDAYDDLVSAAWAGVIEARSGLDSADEVLGVRNGVFNDAYEVVLSAKNEGVLTSAKTAFLTAESAVAAAEASVLGLHYGASSSVSVNAANDVEDALSSVAVLLMYTRQVVHATLTSSDFTATELSALAATIDTSRAALQVDQAALENAFQAVSSALSDADAAYEDAANAYASAQAIYAQQVALASQNREAAEALVDLRETELDRSEASLSEIAAAPRVVDLASYEAEVERTRAAYASAQARLEGASITSPIAGLVTDVVYEIGEQIVAATPVVTVQTTDEQFEITADVSESDIAKVSVEDAVTLTFDAFGDDRPVMGYVGHIDPAEKSIEGVVYYEITVYLDPEVEQVGLRPGMSADLEILTDAREASVSVSQRAILEDMDGVYVRVLEDGEAVRMPVTVGLRADLGRVEIIEGLIGTEEVILREIEL